MDGCGGIRALARWEVVEGVGGWRWGLSLGRGGVVCCLAWLGQATFTGQVGILVLYSYPGILLVTFQGQSKKRNQPKPQKPFPSRGKLESGAKVRKTINHALPDSHPSLTYRRQGPA